MQATKRQAVKDFWERTTANIKLDQLPLLSANEQTKFSWAREVETLGDVPEIFKGFFESLPNDDGSLPNAVLTPKFEGFIRRENQKLLCDLDHKVYILEDSKDGLLTTCYALQDIHYGEVGRILLNAWIKITGVAVGGVQTSTTLKFNTVTEYMFVPILHTIRTTVNIPDQADLSVEQRKFDPLGDASFKLMNYARDSLLPGEQVLEAILQLEIKHNILTIYGRSLYRTISSGICEYPDGPRIDFYTGWRGRQLGQG